MLSASFIQYMSGYSYRSDKWIVFIFQTRFAIQMSQQFVLSILEAEVLKSPSFQQTKYEWIDFHSDSDKISVYQKMKITNNFTAGFVKHSEQG